MKRKVLSRGFSDHSLYSLIVFGGDPCSKNPPASIDFSSSSSTYKNCHSMFFFVESSSLLPTLLGFYSAFQLPYLSKVPNNSSKFSRDYTMIGEMLEFEVST